MEKIIIIAHYGKSIKNLRGDLIQEWIQRGMEVVALAPEEEVREEVEALGARYRTYPLERAGINPLKDLKTLSALMKILEEEQPERIFTYAIKPNIYGNIAARIKKVPKRYGMINGAGFAFSGEKKSLKERLVSQLVRTQYKIAFRKIDAVFFQNPEDQLSFEEQHLLKENTKRVRIHGSGVNLQRFSPKEEKKEKKSGDPVLFLFMARLLKDKGILEYAQAAGALKKKYPRGKFQVLGPFDGNPSALKEEQMETWQREGIVQYLGETGDVRPYLEEADVFVLPTYYKEGVPRSILEAMAMGKPIITTDTPGCRETVETGSNGFLVRPKDGKDLTEKMEVFLQHPDKIIGMGKKSRERAEENFDVVKVNRMIINEME